MLWFLTYEVTEFLLLSCTSMLQNLIILSSKQRDKMSKDNKLVSVCNVEWNKSNSLISPSLLTNYITAN